MKKLTRKLFAPLMLFALALGVGVSLMHEKEVVGAKALTQTYTYTTGDGSGTGAVWTYDTGDFHMIQRKNSSSSNIATTYPELRVYAQHSMEIVPKTPGGYAITSVEVTASNTSYATAMRNATVEAGTDSANTTTLTGVSGGSETTASFNLSSVANVEFAKFTVAAQARTTTWVINYTYGATSKALVSIVSSGTPTKTAYYDGDSFDPTGLTITANFDDGSDADVTANTTYTPDPLTTGTTSVTASYTYDGVTQTTTISGLTVNNVPTLEIIVISGTMTKTDYVTTDSWDPDGLIVTAVYSDDSEVVVTDDVTWSYNPAAPNSTTITSVDVTATYGGETDSKTVSVTVSEKVSTVVISEVYGGGGNSGAAYKNDFVELYNNTNTSINISGWSVQYASATGSFNNRTTFPDNTIILPYNYFLVRWAAGTGTAPELPTPDVDSTNVNAGATNLKVALTNNDTAPSGPTDSNVVDYVGAGNANDYEGAAATGAANATSISRTKSGNIYVDTDNNSNDFSVTTPTPFNSALGIADKIMAEDTDMQCVTKFPEMKALVVQLTPEQLTYFQTSGDEGSLMASARARYNAWAIYHGDTDAYGTGSSARSTTTNSSSNNVAAIALIGVIGITTLVGYYFINKKRLTA